ncbi:MAG TPA: hypothetical protein VHL52_07975 [Acidimicrobiia bacterium]|nr:hypothetical protein [Acidimicrobiia bacterium]
MATWPRTDGESRPWVVDEVMEALATTAEEEVVILAGTDRLEAIPVDRG